jgi:hypothetical protein
LSTHHDHDHRSVDVILVFKIPKGVIISSFQHSTYQQTFYIHNLQSTMKLFTTITIALTSSASAFVVGPLHLQTSNRPHATLAPLEASKQHQRQTHWGAAVSGAIVGWTLATQIATASVVGTPMLDQEAVDTMGRSVVNYPTTMLSLGAYQPEEGYSSLDLSMPKYKVEEISAPKEETLSDPVKEEERLEKKKAIEQVKAEKEQEQAKKGYEKQMAIIKKKAEKEAVMAEVAAGRQAAKEAKLTAK